MAEIKRFPWVRHLRSEPSSHILAYRNGRLKRSGRGLVFWFLPMGAAIAEVPVDDRDQALQFTARTADFQEVTVQGVVTYRVVAAERLASRVDFAIDLERGTHRKQPLDAVSALLTGLARQRGLSHVARFGIRELMTAGLEELQGSIRAGLVDDAALGDLGIEVVTARIHDLRPTAELERALMTPTREMLQQAADEATFQRRALAVEKERAIAENELKNQIELAKREEELIAQHGQNERQRQGEGAEAQRIAATASAERTRLVAAGQADEIRAIEGARAHAEKERLDAYRDLPTEVLVGLALRELPEKLVIDHLSVTPELLAPLVHRVLEAGARKLER